MEAFDAPPRHLRHRTNQNGADRFPLERNAGAHFL